MFTAFFILWTIKTARDPIGIKVFKEVYWLVPMVIIFIASFLDLVCFRFVLGLFIDIPKEVIF